MSTAIWLVLLLQLCSLRLRNGGCGIEARHHPEPHQANALSSKSSAIDHEHKLLLECQHSDYRTYIKCLKREKRQHFDETESGHRRTCLDECLEKNCTNHECTRDCYTGCKRRIIEVSSKTVETTFDCAHGDCNSNVPNITTNIHIQNMPPNITLHCGKTGESTGDQNESTNNNTSTESLGRKSDINNVINNNFIQQSAPPICPCPGCYCYQWQPQITIGIGLGPIGGGPIGGNCLYPSWPCIQKNPSSADCSMCNNPFLRYHCSPTCAPMNSTVSSTRNINYGSG